MRRVSVTPQTVDAGHFILPAKINQSHLETPPADADRGGPVPTRVTMADRRPQTGVRVLRCAPGLGERRSGERG